MSKPLLIILNVLLFQLMTNGQFYVRGIVTNEKKLPISNVKIILGSNHAMYSTGIAGDFGITSSKLFDTLFLSQEGYESLAIGVNCNQWQNIVLKTLPVASNPNKPKLISVTKNLEQSSKYHWFVNNETYFELIENDFVDASKFPNTGFSLNVNKASYSNVRRFLNAGSTVPPDAVRTEELLNYFNLHRRKPINDEVFKIESQLTNCPWDSQKKLLFLNINAKKLILDKIPPSNFVFLIDVSGSMDMPNKLPLIQAAFQSLVKNLRPIDTISIVTYGGSVSIALQPTSGFYKDSIAKTIEALVAIGDTPGESAIITAYKLADSKFIKGGSNRVILATDGDFNVGQSSEKAMDELITRQKQSGVFLTCLGVGMGNFKDSKLETLAKRGNGNYAYLDNIAEGEKVLVKELTQTFYAVANNVYLNTQFNSKYVKTYRLIGFDNKRDAVSDSSIDMEGGEIGSGSSVLAVFEIVLQDGVVFNSSALNKNELATLSLRYNEAGDSTLKYLNYYCPPILTEFNQIDKDLQFATAVTMFGLKLKQSKFSKEIDWDQIENLTKITYNPQDFLQSQFLELVLKAKEIYKPRKGRKIKIF